MTWVLDASALLALLFEEPGIDQVSELSFGATIGAVNLAEAATKIIERGYPGDRLQFMLGELAISVFEFDRELAYRTGDLRRVTRHLGLSLGDRACLALAQRLNQPVLTADRSWQQLSIGVEVRTFR